MLLLESRICPASAEYLSALAAVQAGQYPAGPVTAALVVESVHEAAVAHDALIAHLGDHTRTVASCQAADGATHTAFAVAFAIRELFDDGGEAWASEWNGGGAEPPSFPPVDTEVLGAALDRYDTASAAWISTLSANFDLDGQNFEEDGETLDAYADTLADWDWTQPAPAWPDLSANDAGWNAQKIDVVPLEQELAEARAELAAALGW